MSTLTLPTSISVDSSEEDSSSDSSENEDDGLDEDDDGPSEKKARMAEGGEYQKTGRQFQIKQISQLYILFFSFFGL